MLLRSHFKSEKINNNEHLIICRNKIICCLISVALFALLVIAMNFLSTPVKGATPLDDPCLSCHESTGVMDGVIKDWEESKHFQENVSCIDCHESDPLESDALLHNGFYVSSVVSIQ